MKNSGFRNPRAARGTSTVELALILPVVLILLLAVVDYARAIQFNNILVAMSREGANLASRTTATPQNIIRALYNTAAPLVMGTHGMIYITQITGTKANPVCQSNCPIVAKVQAQTRATTGDYTLPSRVWACPAFSNGSCTNLSNPIATLSMTLKEGDVVYAVETFYDYTPIVTYVMKTDLKLNSLTVL